MDAYLNWLKTYYPQAAELDQNSLMIVGIVALVVSLLAVILCVAVYVCIFATARRTRKLKRMEKKLDELLAANQALMAELQKKQEMPANTFMFPFPQEPHPGSSWRRR